MSIDPLSNRSMIPVLNNIGNDFVRLITKHSWITLKTYDYNVTCDLKVFTTPSQRIEVYC